MTSKSFAESQSYIEGFNDGKTQVIKLINLQLYKYDSSVSQNEKIDEIDPEIQVVLHRISLLLKLRIH